VNGVRSQSLRRFSIESPSSASSVIPTVSTASPSTQPTTAPTMSPTMSPTAVMETPSTSPTTNSTSSESFRLRLHWQPGYRWQESDKESWFCAACAVCNPKELFGGRKNCALQLECKEDHNLAIWGCDPSKPLHRNITEFVKLTNGSAVPFDIATDGFDGDQIQAQGTKLCLTKMIGGTSYGFTSMKLKPCNSTIKEQQFFGQRGGVGQAMEIQPFPADGRQCMSNHHHPRPEEQIYAELCDRSRFATNNMWCPFSSVADTVRPPCTPTKVSAKPTIAITIKPTSNNTPTTTPTTAPTIEPTQKPTTIPTSKRPSSKKPVMRPTKKNVFQ
jgi:hypothetical protein